LIISATPKGNIYGAIARWGINVRQLANVSGLGSGYLRGGALGQVLDLLYRVTFERIDHVFFENSSDHAQFINRQWIKISSASITPGLGVDLKKFSFCPLPKKEIVDKIRFLMVSRAIADKGVREYAAVAELIKEKYPLVEFHLLGERSPDNPTAIDPATLDGWISNGYIIHHDHIRDIRPQVRSSDCVVLPSYREGMSRALLEAGAMGRPLIASNVPGCREIVDDGVTGFLCDPRDVASLFNAVENFLLLARQQQTSMGKLSYQKVARQFNEELVIDQYIRQIDKLTNPAIGSRN
jgi:glycosyltransferase involved in cell wall biosynthesis